MPPHSKTFNCHYGHQILGVSEAYVGLLVDTLRFIHPSPLFL